MTPAHSQPDRRHCGFSHDLQECGGRGATRRDGRQSDIKSDRQTSEEERDILHADDAIEGCETNMVTTRL